MRPRASVDPGFSGNLTLELSNVANLPIAIYPQMKIGQLAFFRLSSPAQRPYGTGELGSKYMGQRGPTASRFFENFRGEDRSPIALGERRTGLDRLPLRNAGETTSKERGEGSGQRRRAVAGRSARPAMGGSTATPRPILPVPAAGRYAGGPVSRPGWEAGAPPGGAPRSRLRMALVAVAAIAVTGLLARPLGPQPPGTLDVENEAPDETPAPTASSTVADTVEPTISTSALPTGETPTTIEATPDTVGPGQGTGYFAGAEDVPITFTLPARSTNIGWGVIKGDPLFGLIFMNVANIYSDSCPSVQVNPPVGPTVDDLASAWASMPGFNATAASDVTVDGFDGKHIEFTVPDYNEKDCTYGMFNLLREAGSHGDYWAQGPNQHHQLWILDVDGTRLVIGATYFPNTSQQDRADLNEILNSIQIG